MTRLILSLLFLLWGWPLFAQSPPTPIQNLVIPSTGTITAQPGATIVGFGSGSSAYATNSGFATNAGYANTSAYSTNSGFATNSGYSTFANFATNASSSVYANTSGYATNSGFATNAGSAATSGTATYSTTSGTSTFATTAGSAPPSGTAGGDLSGTFPNPTFNLALTHTWTGTQTFPAISFSGNGGTLIGDTGFTGTIELPAGSGQLLLNNGNFSGTLTGATGTLTGALVGNATSATTAGSTGSYTGTLSPASIALASGSIIVGGASNTGSATPLGTGVQGALGNAVVGTGTQLVTGNADANGNTIIAPSGTGSSMTLAPRNALVVPNLALPSGLTYRLIAYGDSLTEGVGSTATASTMPYTGSLGSWPDDFAVTPEGLSLQVWNLGITTQTTFQGLSQYTAGSGTTTGTTAGSTTLTITGSTSGMSGTMAIASSTGDIPPNTTATISGSTVTLSQAATGSHSGQTIYFATSTTYGWSSGNIHTSPFVLSEAVTGLPTWFINAYVTNNYYLGCMTATGTASTGSGTITGVSIVTADSVSGASLATAVTGTYAAYGGTGSGNGADFTYLGTIASQSGGTSFVVSNPSAVTSSMVTFKLETPPTNSASDTGGSSWWANYQALNNLAVGGGDQVLACPMYPFVAASSAYAQGQYDENRIVFNALIRTTYSTGTVSGVTLCDLANIPQLQYLLPNGSVNPNYAAYRNGTSVFPHPNNAGYSLVSTAIQATMAWAYPSSFGAPMNPFSLRGISNYWLQADVPLLDAGSNFFTGSMEVFGFTIGATGSGTSVMTMPGNSQFVSGGFGDAWQINLNNSWTTYGNWSLHGPIGEVVFTDKKNSVDELTLTPGANGGVSSPILRASSATGTSTFAGQISVTGTTTLATSLTGIANLTSGVVGTATIGTGLNYTTGTLTATGLSGTSANLTAQNAAVTSVVTVTPTTTSTYQISPYLNVTAIATDVIEVQVTYSDENAAAQTLTFFPMGLTSALVSTTGPANYPTATIRAGTGSAIIVKTTLTTSIGTITYDVGATIQRIN